MKLLSRSLATILALASAQALAENAFLGVYSEDVPELLAAQLELEGGGVVVADVAENSPASVMLRAHDVITRVNDTIVTNPAHFHELIAGRAPGETIQLQVVRKGQPMEIGVVLGELPKDGQMPPPHAAVPEPVKPFDFNIEIDANFDADAFRKMMELRMQEFERLFGQEMKQQLQDFDEGMQGLEGLLQQLEQFQGNHGQGLMEMLQQLQQFGVDGVVPAPDAMGQASAEIMINQNGYHVAISEENGQRSAVVVDENGNEVFSGPINTEEELDQLPPRAREIVDDMNFELEIVPRGSGGIAM